MKTGVMICGHGSRSQSAVDEFATLADKLPALLPDDWMTDYGYLEFANPVIRDGLDKLREAGCDRILAVPGMLFAAMHAKNDIPTVLNTYAAKHGMSVSYGRELGVDPKMIAAAAGRIQEAVDQANADFGTLPLEDTCLVVIGRGASDPDANGNVAKIARMVSEGMGFGWHEVGYSGVTFPLVEPCLQHVTRLGYKRVIVFPYFLFSGILIDRIYGFTDQVAAEYPDIDFVKAGYLGIIRRSWPPLPNGSSSKIARRRRQIAGRASTVCKFWLAMGHMRLMRNALLWPLLLIVITLPLGPCRRRHACCASIALPFWGSKMRWARFRKAITTMLKAKGRMHRVQTLLIVLIVKRFVPGCAGWKRLITITTTSWT